MSRAWQVTVFVVCAILTIATILFRRPAELGGNTTGAKVTAAFFVFLWVVYVAASWLATEKVIKTR